MSYCRFGEDSDVYIFQSFDQWACCGCPLGEQTWFNTLAELKIHVQKHINVGHKVPDYVLGRINAEMESGKSEYRTVFETDIPEEKISPPEWN